MMNINDYIQMAAKDLIRKLNAGVPLCQCNTLTFKGEQLPDYNDAVLQDLYILRYGMAYAYEYKKLYKTMMDEMDVIRMTDVIWFGNKLEVVSFGCGTMIDYWALKRVFSEKAQIIYHGVDVVDWNNKVPACQEDVVKFHKQTASEYLASCEKLTADAYVFPKSISELDDEEIEAICNVWREKNIENEEVSLLFAMRSTDGNMLSDFKKAEKLCGALSSVGMTCTNTTIVDGVREKVYNLDEDFAEDIWWNVYNMLKNLPIMCKKYTSSLCNCNLCRENRNLPIGYNSYMKLKVFTFRKAA